MPQIFHQRSNTIARASILAGVLFICFCGWLLHTVYWSPYETRVNVPLNQPVPFSHRHHAGELGIDCRYCHTSVEKSAFAGLPETEICMTCHSQLYNTAPLLEPVRQSLAENQGLRWNRVNKLPDFVFFNHSIHVNKGIGCSACHGAVNEMPLTWKTETLYMKFCLECHRQPEKFIRTRAEVLDMQWQPAPDQSVKGKELLAQYHIHTAELTDCSMCHR
jgi:hypothetical protein